MNAHPEAQLKLMELFAMLANQGRHIVITTHSPYLVDHLNNLIQGASLNEQTRSRLAESLKLKQSDAFIEADMVSAYLFQDDGAIKNLMSEGAIDLDSFATESDYVFNLGNRIAEAERGQADDDVE